MVNAVVALPMTTPAAPDAPAAPAAPTSRDEALDALFALAVRALGARRCSLYLRADDGASLRLHNAIRMGEEAEAAGAADVSMDGTVAGLVARARVPLLVQNIVAYPALPTHPGRYATGSFVSAPILVENGAAGVLNATDRHDGVFSEDDLQTAELVARAISMVLHSDLLVQRALEDSDVDLLTGLCNRRYLQRRLREESLRAHRAGAPLTLLLLAVGCYATVAANVGVQTAGVLMRCVGELVGRVVRQSDVVALYEGGQIAVLLPATSTDEAHRVARTIMREVLHEKLPAHLRYDCERLDLCIGLSSLGASSDDADLVRHAEEALRIAAAGGDGGGDGGVEPDAGARRPPTRRQPAAVALARAAGVPYLADPAAAAAAAAASLLSPEVARGYACFPVAFEGGTLTLAMVNPMDADAIHAVSRLTGMAVYPVASPRLKVLQAIGTLMRGEKDGSDGTVLLHTLREEPWA